MAHRPYQHLNDDKVSSAIAAVQPHTRYTLRCDIAYDLARTIDEAQGRNKTTCAHERKIALEAAFKSGGKDELIAAYGDVLMRLASPRPTRTDKRRQARVELRRPLMAGAA